MSEDTIKLSRRKIHEFRQAAQDQALSAEGFRDLLFSKFVSSHLLSLRHERWKSFFAASLLQERQMAFCQTVHTVLGVGLSVFMQVKANQDEDRIRTDLRNNRQNVRSQFNAAANELENYARQYIKDNVNRPLGSSIAVIGGNIQEIGDGRSAGWYAVPSWREPPA